MAGLIGGYTVEVDIIDRRGETIGSMTVAGGRDDHVALITTGGFVDHQPLEYVWQFFELLARDIRESGRPNEKGN